MEEPYVDFRQLNGEKGENCGELSTITIGQYTITLEFLGDCTFSVESGLKHIGPDGDLISQFFLGERSDYLLSLIHI